MLFSTTSYMPLILPHVALIRLKEERHSAYTFSAFSIIISEDYLNLLMPPLSQRGMFDMLKGLVLEFSGGFLCIWFCLQCQYLLKGGLGKIWT